jgi:KaiC/GvpD/RAD55 family RecA-like ATPase
MFRGVVRGVHSEWVYKRLEDAYDGIIDFRLEETGEETQDLMRIRSMRDLRHDRKWHRLKIADNFEVTLEK